MFWTNIFDRQIKPYQALPKLVIEAAQPDFWRKYVGLTGVVFSRAGFCESASAPALHAYFCIIAGQAVDAAHRLIRHATYGDELAITRRALHHLALNHRLKMSSSCAKPAS